MLPTNLVLCGGGVNAIAEVGAIMELHERNFLTNIKRVIGTSAGAFIGLSVVLKFDHQDYQEFLQLDFNKFLNSPPGLFSNITLFFNRLGVYNTKYAREQVNNIIQKKLHIENATFAELFKKTGVDFQVVTTNASKKATMIFSAHNTPNTRVDIAVATSMAVPFLFTPSRLKEHSEGQYAFHPQGELFLDGGLMNNFPLYDCDQICQKENPHYHKNETLGLYLIDNEHQLHWIKHNQPPPTSRFAHALHYLIDLIKLTVLCQVQEVIRATSDSDRIILINVDSHDPLNFALDQTAKDKLLASGRAAAEAYYQKVINKEPQVTSLRAKL